VFPSFMVKRPEQTYLNTCQGTPLKTLGKSLFSGFHDMPTIQGDLLSSDYLLFTNEFAREQMMRDYMLEDQYGGMPLLMGSPRNKVFFDRSRESVLREDLGLESKRVYVYMPTGRGGSSRQMDVESYSMEVEDYLSEIDAALEDDTVMFVKLDALVDAHIEIDEYAHVRRFPAEFETHDLLSIADCLITDYSPVLFDFTLTGREILLFAHDVDEYNTARRLYFPYDALPFPAFSTAQALAEHLREKKPFVASPEYEQFAREFTGLDTPGAAKALNDVALGLSSPPEMTFVPQAVDVVFVPYLTKKGRTQFEQLLNTGYNRDDVVFVMSGHRYRARAGKYMYNLFTERGIDINYRVTSDRILLSLRTALMAWAYRRFGRRSAVLDRAYLQEARRLFGNTYIRSARDFSGYKKFSAMADVIDRHADSGPI